MRNPRGPTQNQIEQQREEEERSRDPAVVAAREKEEAEKRKLQEEIDQVGWWNECLYVQLAGSV